MIDKKNGDLLIESKNIRIGKNMTKTELLNFFPSDDIYAIKNTHGEYYRIELKEQKLDGLYIFIICYFYKENLNFISLYNSDRKYSTSWDDWSEEKELARKESHDKWLLSILGKPPYKYKWGKVLSVYDSKGGFSLIMIRYNEKYFNKLNRKGESFSIKELFKQLFKGVKNGEEKK